MSHRLAATVAAAVLSFAGSAAAQDAQSSAAETARNTRADDNGDLAEVIVTGTRAKNRTVLDSPVPVDVLTAQDMRSAASVGGELGQALQVLLPSFNFPRQSNSGGADHVRAAQLRGLSPDQVLVLVNGKRRHTSALVNDSSKIGRGTAAVDFNSIPVSAIKRIEVLRDGAGAQYGSDAVAGVINVILDDGAEGGELSASYGGYHTHQDAIDKTTTDGQNVFYSAKAGAAIGDGGFIRAGAEYKDRNPTNRAGFDGFDDVPGRRNYAMGDGEARDVNAWFNGDLPFSFGEAYAFGTYNTRDTTGYAFYRYPDAERPIFPEGYLPQSLGENTDISASAGLRGDFASAWTYDASLTHGRNKFESAVQRTINTSLGAASPTYFNTGDYELRQSLANLDFTRALNLGGRNFLLALGGEYRYENYVTGAGDEASYAGTGADGASGLRPSDTSDIDRNVFGVYLDLSGDLTDKLFVDIATRYEDYDDAGDKLTGKLSARYQLVDAVALRGAVSNNFRAPSLTQIGFQSTTSNFGDGGVLVDVRTLSVNDPIARALGARDLKPETSENFSLGVTGQLSDRLDVSLDVFQINIDDRVTLSQRLGSDALEDFVEDNFGVSGVHDVVFFSNAANTRTRGAELVSNYRQPLFAGKLLVTTSYTYNKTKVRSTQAIPGQLTDLDITETDLVGVEERNTLTDATPRDRFIVNATWNSPRWGLLGRVTRHGKTTRVFNFGGGYEPTQTYDARWQLDAEVSYRVTQNLSFAVGGNNLTDNYPERSSDEINYGGNLPYDVLSPIGSNGAYYYGRAAFTF